jgi:DNA excision repair protein ERCC-2
LTEIDLSLVYFDIDSQEETVLTERYSDKALDALFVERCELFKAWVAQELDHKELCNTQLAQLKFPYESFHSGQRQLADAVFHAAARAECLLAQAATGVGKTLGTLFPMLKAMSLAKLDKIFYLTAKSTGRELALDALRTLQRTAPSIRMLELVAREKACAQPDKECNGESCPLARGFYDKLAAARSAALRLPIMNQTSLRKLALDHELCPYYLSQEMVRWSDVVVGDYSYYFDHGGLLHTLTLESDWRVGLLVDEAHNLIDRARDMYSATLDWAAGSTARASAPPSLRGAIDAVMKHWDAFAHRQETQYAAYDELPKDVVLALKAASVRIGEYSIRHADVLPPALLEFYFAALKFNRLADVFSEHSIFDIVRHPDGEASTLNLRNVIPGYFLKSRFEDAHCAVLFSATLSPMKFYRDVLGLPKETNSLDAASPFTSDQLSVRIASHISTRYRNRTATAMALVELIEAQYTHEPGNYLFFASSFDYLAQVWTLFKIRNRSVRCWTQSRTMTEADRKRFVARFDESDRGIASRCSVVRLRKASIWSAIDSSVHLSRRSVYRNSIR